MSDNPIPSFLRNFAARRPERAACYRLARIGRSARRLARFLATALPIEGRDAPLEGDVGDPDPIVRGLLLRLADLEQAINPRWLPRHHKERLGLLLTAAGSMLVERKRRELDPDLFVRVVACTADRIARHYGLESAVWPQRVALDTESQAEAGDATWQLYNGQNVALVRVAPTRERDGGSALVWSVPEVLPWTWPDAPSLPAVLVRTLLASGRRLQRCAARRLKELPPKDAKFDYTVVENTAEAGVRRLRVTAREVKDGSPQPAAPHPCRFLLVDKVWHIQYGDERADVADTHSGLAYVAGLLKAKHTAFHALHIEGQINGDLSKDASPENMRAVDRVRKAIAAVRDELASDRHRMPELAKHLGHIKRSGVTFAYRPISPEPEWVVSDAA